MIKRYNTKRILLQIALLCLFSIATFVFLLNSPQHPWIRTSAYTDSSVFQTVAMMMEHGYFPYRDSFDHKGPLIYLYNYLGRQIDTYTGIWYVEFASLLATFIVLYTLARLSRISILQSVITVFTAMSLMFGYFEGGNLTEEYAMPFIAMSLFIFVDYFLNGTISRIRLIICGACFAAVLLLRPNMTACWIVFCLAVLIQTLASKQYTKLAFYFVWFICGLSIIMLPILLWMVKNVFLSDFWSAYVVFNMQYSSNPALTSFANKWKAFFTFFNTEVCLFSVFSILAMIFVKRDTSQKYYLLDVSYLFYFIVNSVLIAISGREYGHYGMILVPAVVFPIASFFRFYNEHNGKVVSVLICAYLFCNVISSNWMKQISAIPQFYTQRGQSHIRFIEKEIADIIRARTSCIDKISVYGNWDIIYILSDRMHASKFSYQLPIFTVKPDFADIYFEILKTECPKVIVIRSGNYDSKIRNFLEKNSYQLVWQQNRDDIQNGAIIFTKLNN